MSEEPIFYQLSIVARRGGKYKVRLTPPLVVTGEPRTISNLILSQEDLYFLCPKFGDNAEQKQGERVYEYNFNLLADLIRHMRGADVSPFHEREDGSDQTS